MLSVEQQKLPSGRFTCPSCLKVFQGTVGRVALQGRWMLVPLHILRIKETQEAKSMHGLVPHGNCRLSG